MSAKHAGIIKKVPACGRLQGPLLPLSAFDRHPPPPVCADNLYGWPLLTVCKTLASKYSQHLFLCLALDSLGFGPYKEEAQAVLQEAKAVATSKRRKKSKLEHLGIPEEELLRQQQELFAQVGYYC